MLKILLIIIIATVPFTTMANDTNEVHTKSILKSVTVFMHGAELHAVADAPLTALSRDIIIEGLPIMINAESVQVSGTGDFTILSVQYKTDFLHHRAPGDEVKRWQDSLDILDYNRKKLINDRDLALGLANIIESNKNVAGSTTGLNAETYAKILDMYASRMSKIKNDILNIELALAKIDKKEESIKKQLEPFPDVPTGVIIVSVSTHNNTLAHLNISYIVNNAGWTPEYDVRCVNVNQPLSIIYKAAVSQSSGMDWNNVKLSINTGNPALSAYSKPLNPWYLNFVNMNERRTYKSTSAGISQRDNDGDGKSDSISVQGSREYNKQYILTGVVVSKNAYDNTEVQLSPVSIEYIIDELYTIPSDNTPHQVSMQNKTIPAYYEYSAAPKVDKDAFLNAFIVRWDTLNFMSGQASIFFKGNYVGKSFISGDNTSDTMSLSLGRDKSIVIKRIPLNNITRTKFLSDKVSKSFSYDISVRNTHSQPISLKIYDQLPLSANSQIEVTDTSYAGASLEANTGKLLWDMKLNGGESKKVNLSFTVKYPKGASIGL